MSAWRHDPFDWAPERKLGGGWICFKDSPSPPQQPDYTGAAVATASGNKDAAIAAQQGSMVNQNTPYGSLKYSQTGTSAAGNPTYTADIDLNQTGQQLLDYTNQSALGLGKLQSGATDRVGASLNQPFDQQSVQDTADRSYANFTSRLDPQWAAREQSQKTELANQGLTAGGEAYDNNMRDFNNARNDAYTQANQAAINTMPQTYQLASALRSQPLNELNAIRTGSQVTNPQFGNTPQQQAVGGPNYSGAAQSQGQYNQGLYNSQVGQQNSMMGGLASLGGSALSAYGSYAGLAAMSDRRLKSNIERIGTHPLGIGIYEYDIFDRHEIGVMAQDVLTVKPEAVLRHPSGYLMVDYGLL